MMTTAPRERTRPLILAAVAALAISPVARGQAPGPNAEARDTALVERWKKEAAEYRVVVETSPATVPAVRAESALDWTNPIRISGGVVLLWVAEGRPEVVACFYRYKWEGRVQESHEFHSLATAPVSATLGGETLWHPRAPGIVPKPIPGAPRPAATPAERLRQMRALAREFKASVDLEMGGTDLRLLAQPVFRYESKADGALFAFVLATDPEAILAIEERPGPDGPAWHYAFARMSNHSLAAKYAGRVAWEVPADKNDTDPAKPYRVRWGLRPDNKTAP